MDITSLAHNYEVILNRIEHAARRAGRSGSEVRLVVVTKTHPVEDVRDVLSVGACCLGESYVEEAISKKNELGHLPGIAWHMIGHVQSRKSRLVSQHFDYVHSLDSLKLARLLDRYAREADRQLPVLLECNVSGEESKYGWPAWEESRWTEILPSVGEILTLPNLQVRGLMTMAPFSADPEEARPYFRQLRRLRDFLLHNLHPESLDELSMGMSADFEVAVEEGATWVRVGTAIMGERDR